LNILMFLQGLQKLSTAGPLLLEKIGARRYSIKVWWRKPGLPKRAVIRDWTKVWSFFSATIWTT
jgi:hypothetical protein